jgi:hypothetical protein
VVNVLETFASTVTTLPKGIALLKATWLTDAVTQIRRECLLAAILAARSIRASNSPPNKLFNGLVSPGKTISVNMVTESEGYLDCILFFAKVKKAKVQ